MCTATGCQPNCSCQIYQYQYKKTEENFPHELPWRIWKDVWIQNTLGWEEVDFINLVWDRDSWPAVVNAVMNSRIS
jgi:hypothetical protein